MEKDGEWASSASVEWNKRIESYGIRIEVGGFGLDPVKARVLKGWKRKLKRGLCCFAFPYYLSLIIYLSITEKGLKN